MPKCFGVIDDGDLGYLFLEDISRTHREANRTQPPSFYECQCLVEALAAFHASMHNQLEVHRLWAEEIGYLPGSTIEERISLSLNSVDEFSEVIKDYLVSRDFDAFTTVVREWNDLAVNDPATKTLVHGDVHFGNVFFSDGGKACLIDWGMPAIGFGELDVAHLLSLSLSPSMSLRWETKLLHAYCDQLARSGVRYDLSQLEERYLAGIRYCLILPVLWWKAGLPESVWLPALRNALVKMRE